MSFDQGLSKDPPCLSFWWVTSLFWQPFKKWEGSSQFWFWYVLLGIWKWTHTNTNFWRKSDPFIYQSAWFGAKFWPKLWFFFQIFLNLSQYWHKFWKFWKSTHSNVARPRRVFCTELPPPRLISQETIYKIKSLAAVIVLWCSSQYVVDWIMLQIVRKIWRKKNQVWLVGTI